MRKNVTKLITLITAGLLCVSGCASSTQMTNEEAVSEVDANETSVSNSATAEELEAQYTSEDIDDTWSESSATLVTLDGDNITVNGSGITVNENVATISEAGTYVFSGKLNDGQIRIEATNEDRVKIVLNGVEISNDDSAVIYGLQADKTTIILAEGTENIVSDGTTYVYGENDNEEDEEPNAAIFSKDDLFIVGKGKLTVNGNYNNGIQSKDDLVLANGTYSVTCINNAFNGKDSLTILDGNYIVDAGHNAFTTKADLVVDGGEFEITAVKKAFHGDNQVVFNGGDVKILSSYEGIEGLVITINDGIFDIVATDDGMNAAKTDDSTTEESESDDVIISADGSTTTREMQNMQEPPTDMQMPEGEAPADMQMPEGEAPTDMQMPEGEAPTDMQKPEGETPTDNQQFKGKQQGGGENPFDEAIEGCQIVINGGKITVNAGGDGLDSNGDIIVTGGETYVNGPENSGNGALDYAGNCNISGGVILAAGGAGMAQGSSETSTQAGLMLSTSLSSGDTISILDDNSNEIFNYSFSKKADCVFISCEELIEGSTYEILKNGTKTGSVTLSGWLTTADETGAEASVGTMMQGGGMGRKPANIQN